MGAGASDLVLDEEAAVSGLGDMPELCVAEVLLRLGAPDICRLARLNRAFRSAAAADFVWEAKLPDNYAYLMGFVDGGEVKGGGRRQRSAVGKKDVYARLARAVRFDDGKREFWLEKSTGMVCMALSSKALVITGIDDRRYWAHMPTTESRFHSVAYLQQIWWFEVVGEIDFRFPAGTYSLYFRLRLGKLVTKHSGRRGCGSGTDKNSNIHGWDRKPGPCGPALDFGRPECRVAAVPGRRAGELGPVPRRRLRGVAGARAVHEDQVLHGADRLHPHEGWAVRRLRARVPQGVSDGGSGQK